MDENYEDWIQGESDDAPVMSHTLFKKKIEPFVKENTGHPMFVVLIDNLRFDQWKMLKNKLETNFRVEKEDIYYSILPTATQYSRNAIFADLCPQRLKNDFRQCGKMTKMKGVRIYMKKNFLLIF